MTKPTWPLFGSVHIYHRFSLSCSIIYYHSLSFTIIFYHLLSRLNSCLIIAQKWAVLRLAQVERFTAIIQLLQNCTANVDLLPSAHTT